MISLFPKSMDLLDSVVMDSRLITLGLGHRQTSTKSQHQYITTNCDARYVNILVSQGCLTNCQQCGGSKQRNLFSFSSRVPESKIRSADHAPSGGSGAESVPVSSSFGGCYHSLAGVHIPPGFKAGIFKSFCSVFAWPPSLCIKSFSGSLLQGHWWHLEPTWIIQDNLCISRSLI